MKKVVFILSYSNNQNAIKRIEEFQNHGITVEAYGFQRHDISNIKSDNVHVDIIGTYDNSISYKKRIPIIYSGIKTLIRKYKNSDVLFYLFGLDVAGLFRFQTRKPYIYEEEDLIYTYFGNGLIRKLFTRLDRYLVKNSEKTVFTSDGFANFHFGNVWPKNISIIPNRLKKAVLDYPPISKQVDINHLRIAFVGSFRFQSVYNFAKVFLSNFPNNTFHFFGSATEKENEDLFNGLKKYGNCVFHGRFKNPEELPYVYSQFDMLLSTYDIQYENVKYAEPNKLYEAIYYDTPIIVSSNCFLGDKVEKLGVGYVINALDNQEVISFIKNLTLESINKKIANIKTIDKHYAIDDNAEFVERIKIDNL